jgi:hypothetical protein
MGMPEIRLPYTLLLGGIVAIQILLKGKCPLTELEKKFLRDAGYPVYSGSCIQHYLQIPYWLVVLGNTTIVLLLLYSWIWL